MMHIAYLSSSKSWGGLELNHLRNAQWMKQRGHEVIMFVTQDSPLQQHATDRQIPCTTIKHQPKYFAWRSAWRLTKFLKTDKITHVFIRGAVANWSKTLANELGQFGITVNNILPGATHTGRLEEIAGVRASKTGESIVEIFEDMGRDKQFHICPLWRPNWGSTFKK